MKLIPRFQNPSGPIQSELNWDAHDWLSKRVDKPVGLKYTPRDVEIFNSHIPEYQQIERDTKANGTWLKMPDGSTWEGDPRAWVMMQSQAYKKNYSSTPWYTGQAAWPTKYDYGNGTVETNKLARAPYYNGQMWFSNNKGYGDVFAHVIDSHGYGPRAYKRGEENIKGHNFLSAIPKQGNYRHLESPEEGTYDFWAALPYIKTSNGIKRVDKDKINKDHYYGKHRLENRYYPEGDEQEAKTDDVVNWSKDLGDQGIFMDKIYDGPTGSYQLEDGSWHMTGESSLEESINEFISQPGFTNKVKFIEGNNGNFDINNPYKYAYNGNKRKDGKLYARKGGRL